MAKKTKIKFDKALEEAGDLRLIISPYSKSPYICIFTDMRVDRSTVPAGWYVYEIRETDDGTGKWATVEPNVLVNFGGTLLLRSKIKFSKGKNYFDLCNSRWGCKWSHVIR